MSRPLRVEQAAAELFARKGLGVGLDEIARHAGVGVGTAYRRFSDKEELIEALFEDRLEQIPALAERAAENPDALAGMIGFMEGAIALQSSDQGLKELFFGSPHAVERVRRARDRILPAVSG